MSPEQLKELVPGTATKADVTALIGSPTQRATFDENTWLYITEVTRPRLGRTLGVLEQEVVVLTFDDRGVLTAVKTVGKDDAFPSLLPPAQLRLLAPKRHSCSNFWAISVNSTLAVRRLQAAVVPAHRLAAVSELRDRLSLGSFHPYTQFTDGTRSWTPIIEPRPILKAWRSCCAMASGLSRQPALGTMSSPPWCRISQSADFDLTHCHKARWRR